MTSGNTLRVIIIASLILAIIATFVYIIFKNDNKDNGLDTLFLVLLTFFWSLSGLLLVFQGIYYTLYSCPTK